MTNSLEQRIQRLEDLEAIRTLQATYGHYVDKGWNGKEIFFDRFSEVFTEDATWECPVMGISANGIQEIVATFKMIDANSEFFIHSFTNPLIEIDGDVATAKWILISPGINEGKTSCPIASYENDYVRTPEGWRIKALRLHIAKMQIA